MKQDLRIGQKLYHYAMGPMTLTRIDGDYLHTTIDDRQGISLKETPIGVDNETHWFTASVGHWIFEDPEDVGNIDNNFKTPLTFYDMPLMHPADTAADLNNWHRYYGKKKSAKSKDSSPIGIVSDDMADSPVGVRGNKKNNASSPVGIVENEDEDSPIGIVRK